MEVQIVVLGLKKVGSAVRMGGHAAEGTALESDLDTTSTEYVYLCLATSPIGPLNRLLYTIP